MASPKRIEARKAEAVEKLDRMVTAMTEQLNRIEKKLDKALGKGKPDEKTEAKPDEA
jgi:hypothetical protein